MSFIRLCTLENNILKELQNTSDSVLIMFEFSFHHLFLQSSNMTLSQILHTVIGHARCEPLRVAQRR